MIRAAGPRSRRVRPAIALPAAAQLLCGLGVAAAQSPADDARDGATTLPAVEVVGSHIRRVELETVHPVLLLQREDLERTGLTSVGEILQQLPQHVSDLNSDYNNGGNGETRVDLRNLGASRTLVLLNGHRYVNTLDGAVDVGSIPLPIVERIEVLTDGASAIYGSDAIAGVVNIVTRDDYAGMEASAYYATSEYGDGERRAFDVTWGRSGERGNLALNLSLADQQPVWAGDRAISAVPSFGLPPNDTRGGASFTPPNGAFGFGPGGSRLPNGQPGQLTYDPATGGYRPFAPARDGYNFAPDNYLRTPYERAALFAQARYAWSPTLSFRSELLVHRRRSSQQLAPSPIMQFGGGGDPGNYSIAADNLYNPFGEPVTAFRYRPVVRPRRFEQDVLTWYLTLGLEGVFELGERHFNWDLGLIEARTRQDDTVSGGYDLNRLGLGVGPSFLDGSGNPRCGTPAAPIAGCVPLDFLHGRDGFTDAMFDYLAASAAVRETRRLRDLTFNLSGDLFDLPAGPLAMAAGLGHRRERGSVALDPLLTDDAFDFGGAPFDSVEGDTRINETYLEFNVPLLAQRPWAHALELSLAARYSDYSSFGDTTNRKLGLSWRPTPDWLLRATWSQGYRAPSTSELFSSSFSFQTPSGFALFADPCAKNPTGVVAQRCAADGVPLGSFDPPIGPRVRQGANPDLQPEQARNRALGVVWSPPAIEGLDLSLDWWRIELTDTISGISPDQLPTLCYVNGFAGACRFLVRDPATGLLLEVDARLQNYGTFELEGYDFGLGYRWESAWGAFALRWDSVYLSRYLAEIPKGAPPASAVGNYTFWDPGWRLRSLLSLDWNRGELGATVRLRYYSALDESCAVPADAGHRELCDRPDFESPTFAGAPEHIIDARTYTDLQLRWEPRDGTRLTLGVNNAFDRDPPVSYDASNSYDPSYDLPGRFWYVSIAQRFR